MIKLQALALILASVVSEVRKTYPAIPVRFIKMKGLERISVILTDGHTIVIECEDPNGINARIKCFNELLALSDRISAIDAHIMSISLIFNENRGHLIDMYFL